VAGLGNQCKYKGSICQGFESPSLDKIYRGVLVIVDGSYPSIEGFDPLSRYKSLLEGKCNPDLCNILVKDKLEK